jgi:hypothetical protein
MIQIVEYIFCLQNTYCLNPSLFCAWLKYKLILGQITDLNMPMVLMPHLFVTLETILIIFLVTLLSILG